MGNGMWKHWVMRSFLLLSMISILFLSMSVIVPVKSESTLWVDDDFRYPMESDGSISKPYTKIQIAINAADDGDTIKVLPGEYFEDLSVDKSVSLRTDDVDSTIVVSNSKKAYMVDIKTSDVSLEGFTFIDNTNTSHRKAVIHLSSSAKNVVISNNVIPYSLNSIGILIDDTESAVIKNNTINSTWGVQIDHSSGNSIVGNNITNCTSHAGIRVISSNGNYIEKNNIEKCEKGINIVDSMDNTVKSNFINENYNLGIKIEEGKNNTVVNNTISNNSVFGVVLNSPFNKVVKNIIYANNVGLNLADENCVVKDNQFINCSSYGIYATAGSSGNIIYNNTFLGEIGASYGKEEGHNNWDNGTKGNYWYDYLGPDNNQDGIGEIPYTKGDVNDRYPTGRFQKPPIITNPQPEHLAEGVDLRPTLKVDVKDPEGERMDVYFYYVLNGTSHLIDVAKNVESEGTASIPFYSTVQGKNAVYSYLGTGYDYICLWYVKAKDKYSETKSDEWIFSTKKTPINNKKPIAEANGPYSGEAGEEIFFDSTGSNDTDGSIVFYRWSFGDETSIVNVKSPTHIYQEPGEYNISLVVIDNDGSSGTDKTKAVITPRVNDPPQAKINGPYHGTVGRLIMFSSAGSYDPDPNDKLKYNWSFGDGETSTEENPLHKYSKKGNYTLTLTLEDKEGLKDIKTTYVIIKKAAKKTPDFTTSILLISITMILLYNHKKNRAERKQKKQ